MRSSHFLDAKESQKFWLQHAELHKKMEEDWAKLPLKEKIKLREKMKANHEAMRNAKEDK